MELKWTKLFINDNFKRRFILLWRLFMGFLKIGSQNYFKILFFLLTNTYILICMWRNIIFKNFDLCLGSEYMCYIYSRICSLQKISVFWAALTGRCTPYEPISRHLLFAGTHYSICNPLNTNLRSSQLSYSRRFAWWYEYMMSLMSRSGLNVKWI